MRQLKEGEVPILLFHQQDEVGLEALHRLQESGVIFRALPMIEFLTEQLVNPSVITNKGDFLGKKRFDYFIRTYIDSKTRRFHHFFRYY